MSLYKPLLIRIGAITLIFIIAAFIIHQVFTQLYLSAFPALLVFSLIMYLGFAFLVTRQSKNRPTLFINRFILLTSIKFFLLFIFILLYLILVKENNVLFLAYVLILYAGYSLAAYSSILITEKNK